jgi:hypothetical protein
MKIYLFSQIHPSMKSHLQGFTRQADGWISEIYVIVSDGDFYVSQVDERNGPVGR